MYRRCCFLPSPPAASSFLPHEQNPAAASTLQPPHLPILRSPTSAIALVLAPIHGLSCRDWNLLLCTISPPFCTLIYCICLGEAQYCIQGHFFFFLPTVFLSNKRPGVSTWLLTQSWKGMKGKGFNEGPWCSVLNFVFACRSELSPAPLN